MTKQEFRMISEYPLELKVAKTKTRLNEAIREFGNDGIYISFSGGKDSLVLLSIARQIVPDVTAVYCDTGLEYPEIKEFVKGFDNVEIIRPKKNFKQIIIDYGYPIISKEQAKYIYDIRTSNSEYIRNRRLNGDSKGRFKLSKKWHFVLDAPFKISDRCCYHMKKSPFRAYERQTGRIPVLGTRADESRLRLQSYLQNGCNSFNNSHPKSTPLAFWKEQDILNYLFQNNIELPSIYGEIVPDSKEQMGFFDDGELLKCTGANRTGCVFCGYGCHAETEPNRFQRLKQTHPKLYDYVINGGEFVNGNWQPNNKGLGFGYVLDYLNVKY